MQILGNSLEEGRLARADVPNQTDLDGARGTHRRSPARGCRRPGSHAREQREGAEGARGETGRDSSGSSTKERGGGGGRDAGRAAGPAPPAHAREGAPKGGTDSAPLGRGLVEVGGCLLVVVVVAVAWLCWWGC
jgi:hypothetical protein